jgi:two-component system chemotaxis response regulator CheB
MQIISEQLSKKAFKSFDTIIAIGASTGGPSALSKLLSKLPGYINAALVVVQHMPAGFTKSLSERLDSITALNVKEAKHGDLLSRGEVLVAPGNYHIVVERKTDEYKVLLHQEAAICWHRPSIDVLFKSLNCVSDKKIIVVVLTGMGSDGTRGILHLKKKTNLTVFAQDEESSVVFGMPRSIINQGLADKIIPLDQMAGEILKALSN